MSKIKTIGDLSLASGVKIPTIRYYEEIGLLPTPPRSEGGRRTYDDGSVSRLNFIRHARELGFEMESIRVLISLQDNPQQSCEEADRLARQQLEETERRIASLTALQGELKRMLKTCKRNCISDCRVINILADHSLCANPHHKH